MITGVPSERDFLARARGLLNLAWEIVVSLQRRHMEALSSHEENEGIFSDAEMGQQTREFWIRSQHEVQNAQVLIHQAVELALKGKILRVSPYLLIARDPNQYPKGCDTNDRPFSAFRTIDASDLVKVANMVCERRLSREFERFWDDLRDGRNANMHSVDQDGALDVATILYQTLLAHELLFDGAHWVKQRLEYRRVSHRDAAYELIYHDFTISAWLGEVDAAISLLSKVDCARFLKFRKNDRQYLCPLCEYSSNKHETGTLPHLAQLKSRSPTERSLHCSACDRDIAVVRRSCVGKGCKCNVLSQQDGTWGMCLQCRTENDVLNEDFSLP